MTDTRISESDLYVPTLEFLAQAPDGFLRTSDLIQKLWDHFQPAGKDAELLQGRNDTHFSQKVRNIVSHKSSTGNLIDQGYVEYIQDQNAVRITESGRRYLGTL